MKKVSAFILSILVISWLIPIYSVKANDSIELDDPQRLETCGYHASYARNRKIGK